MPPIELTSEILSELTELLVKPDKCVTLGDADVLLDLAGRPKATANTVWTFCALIPVKNGEENAIEAELKLGVALEKPYPGVHFARLVLVPDKKRLVLAVIFDQSRAIAINFLVRNEATLEPVLSHCAGYVAGWAQDAVALDEFLQKHDVAPRLLYVKYRWPENVIAESVALRGEFLALVRGWELDPKPDRDARLLYRFDDFLVRHREMLEPPAAAPPAVEPVFAPPRTNSLTMVHPIKPGNADLSALAGGDGVKEELGKLIAQFGPIPNVELFKLILGIGQLQVHCLRKDPLKELHTLHFARIALIDETTTGPKMLFASVYDGDFEQYVLDFGSRVADEIDGFWGLCVGYPPGGCRDVNAFVQWMKSGTVDAPVFHVGHPEATVREIEQATALRRKLLSFCDSAPFEPSMFPERLRKFIKKNQALLA